MTEYRKQLFSRIVPNLKKVGMWGPKIQETFVEMRVIDYQDVDPESLMADDQQVAGELERILAARRERGTIAHWTTPAPGPVRSLSPSPRSEPPPRLPNG